MYDSWSPADEGRFMRYVLPVRHGRWICWEWQGKRCRYGYGRFWLNGRWLTAHKVAFILIFGGAVPDGMHLDHKCENEACVKSSHLEVVTQAENQRRRAAAARRLGASARRVTTRSGSGSILPPVEPVRS